MENLLHLQNGSDIRGVAMGEKTTLTPQIVAKIAFAFGGRLSFRKSSPLVSVGYDSRLTGKPLCEAICAGLLKSGCRVVRTGLSSTPSMFMTCIDESFKADGAIMITASHLPKERNGMKIFTKKGGYGKSDIKELLIVASSAEDVVLEISPSSIPRRNYMLEYSAILANKIKALTGSALPFEGLHIIVDAGGGAGGFYAENVLAPLGANIEGSLYLTPDGTFSGHIPNPEDDNAIKEISKAVADTGADFGVIFDTDVDRAAFIGKGGVVINKNKLIAISAAMLATENPGATIVTDSITSVGLKNFLENTLGMVHHRFKRGYKNVIDEAKRLIETGVNAPLAIETSGHAALAENYFLDDGAYLATRILASLVNERSVGKNILDLISALPEPADTLTRRFQILEPDFSEYGKSVLSELGNFVSENDHFYFEVPNYEGVRVNVNSPDLKGWFLLRLSLHDPVLALDIESENSGGATGIANLLTGFLSKFNLE